MCIRDRDGASYIDGEDAKVRASIGTSLATDNGPGSDASLDYCACVLINIDGRHQVVPRDA